MLIRNIDPDAGLVNGARGIVTEFSKQMGLPVVRFRSGVVKTVHREQWTVKVGSGQHAQVTSRPEIPIEPNLNPNLNPNPNPGREPVPDPHRAGVGPEHPQVAGDVARSGTGEPVQGL